MENLDDSPGKCHPNIFSFTLIENVVLVVHVFRSLQSGPKCGTKFICDKLIYFIYLFIKTCLGRVAHSGT